MHFLAGGTQTHDPSQWAKEIVNRIAHALRQLLLGSKF